MYPLSGSVTATETDQDTNPKQHLKMKLTEDKTHVSNIQWKY
jgi:hypothetical protein